MKVLVTGGAGFIGAHVARELARRGDEVVIIDDFNDRYDPRLKEARVDNLLGVEVRVARGDIAGKELVGSLFAREKFDGLVHLAAWASVPQSLHNPYVYSHSNVQGTVVLLEAAARNSVGRMVFASSSSVYGGRTDVPFRETDNVMRPISPYAATKVAGEALCSAWHAVYGMPISVLRFFNVYGAWGRPEGALFKFANAIVTGQEVEMRGRQTARDFTYIDDCVAGVITALDRAKGFEVFNLGEADSVPLPRFIAAIETALGRAAKVKEVPLPKGELPRSLADISKAERLLGYRAKTTIEAGVAEFGQWYKEWYVSRFVAKAAVWK